MWGTSGWGLDTGPQRWGEELGVDYGNGLRTFEGCDLFYNLKKPPVSVSGQGAVGGRVKAGAAFG